MTTLNDALNTAQAAALVGKRAVTIRAWVRLGLLVPARREGRGLLFDADAVRSCAAGMGRAGWQTGRKRK